MPYSFLESCCDDSICLRHVIGVQCNCRSRRRCNQSSHRDDHTVYYRIEVSGYYLVDSAIPSQSNRNLRLRMSLLPGFLASAHEITKKSEGEWSQPMQAPHPELFHTLIALAAVSIASVVGSVSFALGKRLQAVIPYLVSAAAGALLGTALCNLVPEALERSTSGRTIGLLLTFGFLLSFVVERLLGMVFHEEHTESVSAMAAAVGETARIHHTHEHNQANKKSLITNVLLSGAVHSLVDGIGIAVAFTSSHAAGVATALAVLLHEVPHHIADVGVLIYSGISKRRAILLNLLATTGCAVGGVLVLLFGSSASVVTPVLLPITAANFLYIAVGILMPELQRERNQRRSLGQIAVLITAVLVISSLSRFFPETSNSTLAHLMK